MDSASTRYKAKARGRTDLNIITSLASPASSPTPIHRPTGTVTHTATHTPAHASAPTFSSTSISTSTSTTTVTTTTSTTTSTAVHVTGARDFVPVQPPPVSKSSRSRPSADSQALRLPSDAARPAPIPSSTPTRHRHPHESFLDNPTPVESEMAELPLSTRAPQRDSDTQRDSHDLSLSPRNVTRDSLVANMLLSLDQLSMGQLNDNKYGSTTTAHTYNDAPQFATSEPTRTWTNSSSANGAGRVNGHQYSYSSDLEGADEASRLSSPHSRGRRSNSSSNFQSGFNRLNSVREAVNRNQPGSSRGLHSRGGKGSKSSSSANSVDAGYVQVLGSQRWARGFGRSASFDGPPQTQQSVTESPFRVEFSNNYIPDEYDAAPTPTVPGGPRREPSIPNMAPVATVAPPMPPAPVEQPTLERKRSMSRSLKSSAGRKVTNNREVAPAMPPLDLDSAPAPHVGYEKTKEAVHAGPTSTNAPAQTKERPGFFRRVFGSSRSNSHNRDHDSTQSSHGSADHADSAVGKMHFHGSTPPSRDTSSSHSHHPILQKKPSSFFRRRKKSVNEERPPVPTPAPVPPMPPVAPIEVATEIDKGFTKPQPSPVSSLRQVMNPYLRNAPGTPQGHRPSSRAELCTPPHRVGTPDRQEYKREFSPDYEPSPNARIRAVQHSDSDEETPRRTDSPTRRPPDRPAMPAEARNNSFLNLDGTSDNDEVQTSPSKKKSPRKAKPNGIDTSPMRQPPLSAKSSNDDTIRIQRPQEQPEPVQAESEDDVDRTSTLALPIEGARAPSIASVSTGTDYKSALSAPPTPSVRIESSNEVSPKVLGTFESIKAKPLDEPDFVIGEPTEDDQQKAQKIYDGNEDFIQKEKAAAWMGEEGPVRQRTLQAYMELYDFTNQSVLYALRQVCGRLVFRAETQQVDRILVAFSKRWCDCNPNHGFKVVDVIHTICYSIMLLNTDLHMADIESKMTRSQFVKNTMSTVTQAVAEGAPDAFDRPSILPDKNLLGGDSQGAPAENDRRSFRHSFRPPPRADSGLSNLENDEDCGPLVKSRFNGTKKAWEEQIEVVLKSIYGSIKDERLPLFGAEPEKNLNLNVPNSQSSLSVMGILKRSPSVLSKAPSESQLSLRGRMGENGRNNPRWNSKSRSRTGLGRNGFSSSRTSFEDGNSLWSPAMSSATWSRYSLGRTQTSVSQDSFGSAMPRGDYQQSIGFANALSQAIIRDEDAYGHEAGAPSILSADMPDTQLLEDESLQLAGPPWAKEGNVVHKHHLDGVEKKAKDRHWSEVFAVIQKGQMSLFSFSASKSMRQKSRTRNPNNPHAPVGGGNWQDNATNVGTFSLRQTLASALPSPGYSRTRPFVWALSLPNGAVHLFQVGTPEIIKEFVTTVNYWSARLSTHPLVGGISNIEYGWSDAIVNNALVAAINETTTVPSKIVRPGSAAAGRRSSVTSASFRGSSFDQVAGAFTNNSGRGKLPGDRIHISDWQPPTQSMRPSNATEEEQLKTLDTYVKGIEEELKVHNQLRSPMLLAYSPRGNNAAKAMNNWEKKSAYLLREIVKFTTYVDCLKQASSRMAEIYAERELAQRAARGELSDSEMEFSSEDEGDVTLRP